MRVRIDFGAVILEQSANPLETGFHTWRITCCYRPGGGQKTFSRLSTVLVQHENRENVAEQHSAGDQRDAAKDEDPLRTHGTESRTDIARGCPGYHAQLSSTTI